ncbi:MAG: hypothetical protein PHQ59_04100 [Candidatus Daviesbacteria bacterium]|nr:hypothetical protein [Candidatus Daviesbacteria bacterium]
MNQKGSVLVILFLVGVLLISGIIVGGSLYIKNSNPAFLNSQKISSSSGLPDNKNIQQPLKVDAATDGAITWKKLVSGICKNIPYSTPTSKLIPTITGEIAAWKISANSSKGYYFRYPFEWEQKTCDAFKPDMLIIGQGLKDNTNSLPIVSFTQATSVDISPEFSILSKKVINIDGKQSDYILIKDDKRLMSTDQFVQVAVPLNNSGYLVVTLYDLSYLTTFEKILSAIKFMPTPTIIITSSPTLKILSLEEQPIKLEQGTLSSTNTKYNFTSFDINISLEIPEDGEYLINAYLDKTINLGAIIDGKSYSSYAFKKGSHKIILQYKESGCGPAPSDNSAHPMPLEITLQKFTKDGYMLPFNQQIKYYLDNSYYTKPHKLTELRKHC